MNKRLPDNYSLRLLGPQTTDAAKIRFLKSLQTDLPADPHLIDLETAEAVAKIAMGSDFMLLRSAARHALGAIAATGPQYGTYVLGVVADAMKECGDDRADILVNTHRAIQTIVRHCPSAADADLRESVKTASQSDARIEVRVAATRTLAVIDENCSGLAPQRPGTGTAASRPEATPR
ncbi:MAG: hypothetical protein WDO70_07445 [Alphaproteobacteria bacterium]